MLIKIALYRLFIFFLFRLVRKFSVYHFGDNLYINYGKSNPGSVLTILFFLLKSDKEIGVIGNSSHCGSIRQSLYKHPIIQNIFFLKLISCLEKIQFDFLAYLGSTSILYLLTDKLYSLSTMTSPWRLI